MVSPHSRYNKSKHTRETVDCKKHEHGHRRPFHEIQEWHVVLGDMHCRKDRTTVATRMLRQVKMQFQTNNFGIEQNDWIPKAIDFFYAKVNNHFAHQKAQDTVPSQQIGQVLWRCTKRTMHRIQVPNVYGYQGDSGPLFGTVKSPFECLSFFLKSRDAPRLHSELSRHKRELDNLRGTEASPSDELLAEFATHITFFQQRAAKAQQGNSVAKALLDELNLIPSLKKVWKCLKEGEGETSAARLSQISAVANAAGELVDSHVDWIDQTGVRPPFRSTPTTGQSAPQNDLRRGCQQHLGLRCHFLPDSFETNQRPLDRVERTEGFCDLLYTDFRQELDRDIVETLLAQNPSVITIGQESRQGGALEPPGRVMLSTNQGIDPEPSIDYHPQELCGTTPEDVQRNDMTQDLDHIEPIAAGQDQSMESDATLDAIVGETGGDRMTERLPSGRDSTSNYHMDTQDPRIQREPRSDEWSRDDLSFDADIFNIPDPQMLEPAQHLENQAHVEDDSVPTTHVIADFGGVESGISVPTAVPVFPLDIGRNESSELSVPRSVFVESPPVLDWTESDATLFAPPTRLVARVSDEITEGRSPERETSSAAQSQQDEGTGSVTVTVAVEETPRLSRNYTWPLHSAYDPTHQDPAILYYVRMPEWRILPEMTPNVLHPKSCCSLEDLSVELDKHRTLFAELQVEKNHPEEDTMLCFEKLLNFFQDQLDLANKGNATARKLLGELSATTAMKNQWKDLEIQKQTSQEDGDEPSICDAKTVLAITSVVSDLDDENGDTDNNSYEALVDDDAELIGINQNENVGSSSTIAESTTTKSSLRLPDPPGRRGENESEMFAEDMIDMNVDDDLNDLPPKSQTRRTGSSTTSESDSRCRCRQEDDRCGKDVMATPHQKSRMRNLLTNIRRRFLRRPNET